MCSPCIVGGGQKTGFTAYLNTPDAAPEMSLTPFSGLHWLRQLVQRPSLAYRDKVEGRYKTSLVDSESDVLG